jgi:hypothetical protein
MPPIIIIEPKLYHPHYQQILSKLKDPKETFRDHERIPYKDYIDVLFPYTYFDAATNSAGNIFACLAQVSVFYQNENIFKQLDAIKCNFNVEDVTKDSLLSIALKYGTEGNPKQEIRNILKILLESETTDLNLYCSLREQTALHYISGRGDAHIEIFKTILKKTKEFTSDIYGANALTLGIQECQYKTIGILLDTEQGQALSNQCRKDGNYPIQIACEQLTDATQGSAVIIKILQCMDREVYLSNTVLFNALNNPNPACRLTYCKLLLEHGADVNEKSPHKEPVIMQVVSLYARAKTSNNKNEEENYKEIFSLLLEYKVNLLFETPHEQKNFLENILSSNVRDLALIIAKHAEENNNKDIVQTMTGMMAKLTQAQTSNKGFKKQQDESLDLALKMRTINAYEDEQKQKCYFELMDKYTLAKEIPLSELVHMFKSGRLNEESILKLIAILDKKPEYRQYIPYLYREHLTRAIVEFKFSTEKDIKDKNEKKVLNLFLCLVKFTQHLPSITDPDEKDSFKLEINNILQNVIQIALLSVLFYEQRNLSKFIIWVDQLDSSYHDDETQLMILQLKITQAYFSDDKKSFDAYYQQLHNILPSQHLLHRQYDYWQVKILFNHAEQENFKTLSQAYSKLERYGLDITLLKPFENQLESQRKKEAENKATQKIEKQKQKAEQAAQIVTEKNNDVSKMITANSSESSSSSTQSIILSNNNNNNNNNAYVEPTPKIKVKTRGVPFAEMLNNAMEELQERLNPQRLNPLFSEADVRTKYADILKPSDRLKPLSYQNKYGEYWVVCSFDDLGLEQVNKERFIKEFDKSNTIHHSASSGFSFKKIFRLMLGHNDLRLHSTLYKNKSNTCSLIRIDEVWRHNYDSFEKRTCYIEEFKISNKVLKK